jgi:hypothetical protein
MIDILFIAVLEEKNYETECDAINFSDIIINLFFNLYFKL